MISPESKIPERLWTDDGPAAKRLGEHYRRSAGTPCTAPNTRIMLDPEYPDQRAPELQLALVRRAADRRDAALERCHECGRTPLVGERVYLDEQGGVYCELCRALDPEPALSSRVVHGPEFGHTMRLTDHRAA